MGNEFIPALIISIVLFLTLGLLYVVIRMAVAHALKDHRDAQAVEKAKTYRAKKLGTLSIKDPPTPTKARSNYRAPGQLR
jgi:hypothetical protein